MNRLKRELESAIATRRGIETSVSLSRMRVRNVMEDLRDLEISRSKGIDVNEEYASFKDSLLGVYSEQLRQDLADLAAISAKVTLMDNMERELYHAKSSREVPCMLNCLLPGARMARVDRFLSARGLERA